METQSLSSDCMSCGQLLRPRKYLYRKKYIKLLLKDMTKSCREQVSFCKRQGQSSSWVEKVD